MNGRCRSILVGGVIMSLLSAAVGGADTLIVGDAIESAAGGFKFPDGTTQTTAYTGGAGGGISMSSPDGSITVGGTSTEPTVSLNFTLTDALYAPESGSTNYAPAGGSPNYVAKNGDTMSGALNINLSGGVDRAVFATTAGLGGSGFFQVSNAASGSPALYGATNGNAEAVRGYTTGAGGAGSFEIANSASNSRAVAGITNGKGAAGYFTTSGTGDALYASAGGSGNAVAGWATGAGKAGHFEIKNAANSSDVLYATTNGGGNAGNFNGKVNVSGALTAAGFTLTGGTPGAGKVLTSDAAGAGSWQTPAGDSSKVARTGDTMTGPLNVTLGSAGTALSGSNTGFGRAGDFRITNSNSSNYALYVETNGNGIGYALYSRSTGLSRAGVFEISNASNGGEAVLARTNGSGQAMNGYTTGSGNAGAFTVSNAANSADALYVSTNGAGRAGYFQIGNAGNGSDALYATTNGTGSAIKGYTTGSGYSGYFQGGAGLFVNGNLTVSGVGAMPVYNNSGTAQFAPHMVTGTVAVSGVGNVTLSGAAAFSSAGSYTCTATMQTSSPAANAVGVEYISGASFNLYCSAAANVSYICVGN